MILFITRAISSVGRAHPLQGWGRKFEPCIAHHIIMKLAFNDLFTDDGHQLTAKKSLRVGALVIPEGHAIDPNDPSLGLPLNDWKSKHFHVSIDKDFVVILQITDPL